MNQHILIGANVRSACVVTFRKHQYFCLSGIRIWIFSFDFSHTYRVLNKGMLWSGVKITYVVESVVIIWIIRLESRLSLRIQTGELSI